MDLADFYSRINKSNKPKRERERGTLFLKFTINMYSDTSVQSWKDK